jgi:hypothetical protein
VPYLNKAVGKFNVAIPDVNRIIQWVYETSPEKECELQLCDLDRNPPVEEETAPKHSKADYFAQNDYFVDESSDGRFSAQSGKSYLSGSGSRESAISNLNNPQESESAYIDRPHTSDTLNQKAHLPELIVEDGQIMGGGLGALVEKLTDHQSTPHPIFVSTFFLTFRSLTTPLEFAEALAERFENIGNAPNAASAVRLRVHNVFEAWLESHWYQDSDNTALDFIVNFAKNQLMTDMPTAGKRLLDLADKVSAVHGPDVSRVSIGETQTAGAQHAYLNTPIPPPILSPKALRLLKQ